MGTGKWAAQFADGYSTMSNARLHTDGAIDMAEHYDTQPRRAISLRTEDYCSCLSLAT